MRPALNRAALAAFALGAAGCDRGPTPAALVPAAGTATLDGKPLAGVSVGLVPEAGPGEAGGVGAETNAQGEFELRTPRGAGAPPGKYKAVVAAALMPAVDPATGKPVPPAAVPAVYADPARTPLRVDVSADGSTRLKLELKSK